MSTTIPAIKAKFGSTEYFIVTMKAQELVAKLRMPRDLPEWEELTVEERFQREVNYKRVKEHIAPYLANDPDRFFGAMIVDIFNPEGVRFEPLSDVMTKGLPGLYNQAADAFGFLHLQGGEVLVPLDGQHRLASFKFAIEGKDEKNSAISGMTPNLEIAKDDVTVILVKHEAKKARKIFNKVNRYAKPTSKTDNLITADDDIVAVIMRKIVVNDMIGERLVNIDSNTLSAKSHEFTTLSTVYEVTLDFLHENHGGKIDTTTLPAQATINVYESQVRDFWNTVLNNFSLFQSALMDKNETGDDKRRELRRDYLTSKPIGQLAIMQAITRLFARMNTDGSRLSLKEIVSRLNKVDWTVTNHQWQNVLLNGDKVVAGRTSAKFASRMIAYMIGEPLEEQEIEVLKDQYFSRFPEQQRKTLKLPPRIA
jgi:DNA sulfur modification protein DndB